MVFTRDTAYGCSCGPNQTFRSRLIMAVAMRRGVCTSISTRDFDEESTDASQEKIGVDHCSDNAHWPSLVCTNPSIRGAVGRIRYKKHPGTKRASIRGLRLLLKRTAHRRSETAFGCPPLVPPGCRPSKAGFQCERVGGGSGFELVYEPPLHP